jgi:hypothetical protein
MLRFILCSTFGFAACNSTADDSGGGLASATVQAAQPSVTATTMPVAAVGVDATKASLATAADLQVVNALALDGGYVYFTGGGTTSPSPDGLPGSDTFGVLRRVPVGGGAVEELWRGQGIGYAVARHADGMAFVTYDYASRGRTGTVRVMRADGSAADLTTWRSQGSCVGLTARDGVLFQTHSAGAGGVVDRIDATGTTTSSAPEGACTGKPRLTGDRLYWLAGSSVLGAATSTLATAPVWTASHTLEALATSEGAPALFTADDDDLVAIDPAAQTTRVVAAGYRGTTDLAFGSGRVYATNSDGSVTALSLAENHKAVIATSQASPKGIITGDGAIFWINAGTQTVMTARP